MEVTPFIPLFDVRHYTRHESRRATEEASGEINCSMRGAAHVAFLCCSTVVFLCQSVSPSLTNGLFLSSTPRRGTSGRAIGMGGASFTALSFSETSTLLFSLHSNGGQRERERERRGGGVAQVTSS